MNNSSLNRVLSHNGITEDTEDRYRKCCLYCRDLVIYMHEMPGKISAAKIFRDIRKSKPFPCSKCPYNPVVKNRKHKKGDHIPDAVCKRNSKFMIKPGCDDTVCRIISRIPEQQDVLSWAGVRSWQSISTIRLQEKSLILSTKCGFRITKSWIFLSGLSVYLKTNGSTAVHG